MAKILDNVGTILFTIGAKHTAYSLWLRAFRIRNNNGDLDQED